jgi:hypothetical protein
VLACVLLVPDASIRLLVLAVVSSRVNPPQNLKRKLQLGILHAIEIMKTRKHKK